jgi:Fur family peroxide stress response transcriptional regulator
MVRTLKNHDCRITPQRIAILSILATSEDHPTVEHIHEELKKDFPMTSLATIYKTVTLLKEAGEVLELRFHDDRNHYDGRKPYPHPHLVCVQCKRIMDSEIPSLNGIYDELYKKTGYRVLTHRMDFFGICPECQKKIGSHRVLGETSLSWITRRGARQ